jgi:hypothetical protein
MQARIPDIDVPSHPEKDHLYTMYVTMYVAPWVGAAGSSRPLTAGRAGRGFSTWTRRSASPSENPG